MTPDTIRECAEDIQKLEDEISELNKQKAKVYARARDAELNVLALRIAIAINRRSGDQRKALSDRDKLVNEYLKVIQSKASRARVPTREDAKRSSAETEQLGAGA